MEDQMLYLLILKGGTPIGVFTNHRKAMQELFMRTFRQELTHTDYTYDMGIEYFTYADKSGEQFEYMIHELTPDVRFF